MDKTDLQDVLMERLRSNLHSEGITISEADVQAMWDKGFLGIVLAFEQLSLQTAADLLPDYLAVADHTTVNIPTSIPAPANLLASQPTSQLVNQLTDRSANQKTKDSLGQLALSEVATLIRKGELSPVELTRQTLERVAERNPQLNAFQSVLETQALESAQQAEQLITQGIYYGPLHGVPLAVKDLLDVAGTPTLAGSKILVGSSNKKEDATAVARLKAAGAVLVGKTSMSEFAYAPGSINAHYGSTRNPRNLEYDTGGSSSGSGAAVADGLVYGALGSDTGGSIRIPAAQCGIIGLKPTYGRVSLNGAVSLSWSCDHLGPMTRTVGDAVLMLEAIAGYDPQDKRTHRDTAFTFPLDLEAGVKGLRIGWLEADGYSPNILDPDTLTAWQAGLKILEGQGAHLQEWSKAATPQISLAAMRNINGTILALEALSFHRRWLRERLADYGEFMRQRILAGYAFSPTAFIQAQQERTRLRLNFENLMQHYDLFTTPTMTGPAPKLGVPAGTTYTAPFNLLGWPAITVPVGVTKDKLPLGLQLVARPWQEALLLRAARTLEVAFSNK
jgi:aspartyl-tRNA(Asn)/glutamyl-tRNA(Gln) amidotransferase subunit A